MSSANFATDLFTIKQKFLSTIPHPKVIRKYIEQIDGEVTIDNIAIEESDLYDFLNEYLNQLMGIKLSIANSDGPISLKMALIQLLSLHNQLINKLAQYVSHLNDSFQVKLSDSIDAYEIQVFLKKNAIQENQISDYLCSHLSADMAVLEQDELNFLNAFARAFKITRNG